MKTLKTYEFLVLNQHDIIVYKKTITATQKKEAEYMFEKMVENYIDDNSDLNWLCLYEFLLLNNKNKVILKIKK